ncbi:MAG: ABC transporter permease [Flammeovirgaceae bacterium]
MFDIDKWQEIFYTIWKNKLRTILTAFSVFWGIFMFIFMMGVGDGFANGVKGLFGSWATNSCFIWGWRTTEAYAGMKAGRFIRFYNDDVEFIKSQVPEIAIAAPHIGRGARNVVYKNETGAYEIQGEIPEFQIIKPMNIQTGRYINPLDLKEKRKVAVLGQRVVDELFDGNNDIIGEYISIDGIFYKVIGTYTSYETDDDGIQDEQAIVIPISTMQQTFGRGNRIDRFMFMAKPGYKVSDVEEKVIALLKKRHKISPEDRRGIGSSNLEEEFENVQGMLIAINFLIIFVGICTIIAGVIGVSNIMLIVVKERTKEIGLRKAMGATPLSIISLIVQESIFITTLAGYFGLLIGVGIIGAIQATGASGEFFADPKIDIAVAGYATLFLIIAGGFAGLFPAFSAARISPVEALRDE